MSHTMDILMELHDRRALEAACRRLRLKMEYGKHQLHATTEEGMGIFLDGWRFPLVIKNEGIISYDNYNGHWGSLQKLHELEAYYGLEKARLEAQLKGYDYQETVTSDNMPRLEIFIN
ncbi:MAG: hypothetical protein E3K40_11685 [Candidatus Brocadia sp.]|nr:hypothetical protein [Candidatus Brocadia sp.]